MSNAAPTCSQKTNVNALDLLKKTLPLAKSLYLGIEDAACVPDLQNTIPRLGFHLDQANRLACVVAQWLNPLHFHFRSEVIFFPQLNDSFANAQLKSGIDNLGSVVLALLNYWKLSHALGYQWCFHIPLPLHPASPHNHDDNPRIRVVTKPMGWPPLPNEVTRHLLKRSIESLEYVEFFLERQKSKQVPSESELNVRKNQGGSSVQQPTTPTPPDQKPRPSNTVNRPLTRLDLPGIIESIKELYRIVGQPPSFPWTPPEWLLKQCDQTTLGSDFFRGENLPSHSGLITFAIDEVLNRLMPPWRHIKDDCSEITESNLDQKPKVTLLNLRSNLLKSRLADQLATNKGEALKFQDYLEEVLTALEGKFLPKTNETETPGDKSSPVGLTWIRVSEAERITGINRGTISKNANNGALRTNGKTGTELRIEAGSLTAWQLQRAKDDQKVESAQEVERKFKQKR